MHPRVATAEDAKGSEKKEDSKVCMTLGSSGGDGGGGGSCGSGLQAGADAVDASDDLLAISVGKMRQATYHVLSAISQ